MNIVLLGMRGSGKSTVGMLLAKQLQWNYVDTDRCIENDAHMPLAEIIKQKGWDAFRDRESDTVAAVAHSDQTVIATGGGVVLRRTNMDNLQRNGFLIFLSAPVETLVQRIGEDQTRPLITAAKTMKNDLQETLAFRAVLYQRYANVTITTTTHTPEHTTAAIIETLQEKNIL